MKCVYNNKNNGLAINVINSFLSRTTFYWSIWTNRQKIYKKIALPPIDVKLGTKEHCRISQSLAVFCGNRLNKLFIRNFYVENRSVSVMATSSSEPVLGKQAQKERHLQSLKEIATQKACLVVKKAN